MTWCDISEWQAPGSVDLSRYDGVIIRASHGTTEDRHWRDHFNNAVRAGRQLGLYHYQEHGVPENEASFFHGLVGFLHPDQVRGGFWDDVEEGQPSSSVDRFRAWVRLPWCGVYSNLAGFNNNLREYMHFGLNWLAMPDGTVVPSGWSVPDHILRQSGQNPIDVDVISAAQPYPGAWA